VELWGKNIFDEHYISELYVIGPGGVGVFGDPRTYGVTVRYKLD
jgi:iron complex outermembrane receptor protein